jgi:hypothetical protein
MIFMFSRISGACAASWLDRISDTQDNGGAVLLTHLTLYIINGEGFRDKASAQPA